MMQVLMNCWFVVIGLFVVSIILERFLTKKYSNIIQVAIFLLISILFVVSIIYMLIV